MRKAAYSLKLTILLTVFLLAGCESSEQVEPVVTPPEAPSSARSTQNPTIPPAFEPTYIRKTLGSVEFDTPDNWKEGAVENGYFYYLETGTLYVSRKETDLQLTKETFPLYINSIEKNSENYSFISKGEVSKPGANGFSTEYIADVNGLPYCHEGYFFNTQSEIFGFIFLTKIEEPRIDATMVDRVLESISLTAATHAPEKTPESMQQTGDPYLNKESGGAIRALLRQHDFQGIIDYIKEYLLEKGPSSQDSVIYRIRELALEAVPYMTPLELIYDSFDGTYTLFYKGVKEINGLEMNVVPRMKGGTTWVKIGFEKEGWLFFDEYEIRADSEKVIGASFNGYDMTRDMLGGKKILESKDDGLASYECEKLKVLDQAAKVTIRFTNSREGKTLDHRLTTDEIAALVTLSKLSLVEDEMYMLIVHY